LVVNIDVDVTPVVINDAGGGHLETDDGVEIINEIVWVYEKEIVINDGGVEISGDDTEEVVEGGEEEETVAGEVQEDDTFDLLDYEEGGYVVSGDTDTEVGVTYENTTEYFTSAPELVTYTEIVEVDEPQVSSTNITVSGSDEQDGDDSDGGGDDSEGDGEGSDAAEPEDKEVPK